MMVVDRPNSTTPQRFGRDNGYVVIRPRYSPAHGWVRTTTPSFRSKMAVVVVAALLVIELAVAIWVLAAGL